jgi:hypothetical protein
MKRGRPSEYKPEYCDKVDEYLAERQDVEVKRETEKGFTYKVKVQLPTIEGFAIYIGVPKRTLYDWKDKYEELSHSLEKIVEEQRKRLLDNGLSGDYNSTIAKLILSSNHGMSEKTVSELTGKDGAQLIPDQFTSEEKESLLSLLNDSSST